MKEKIIYLMKSEGLTTSRFAEILGIQPSAVSHLASGRNKPSYDILQKILRRFPRINPDWFLLDEGEPYRPDLDDLSREGDALGGDLFAQVTPLSSAASDSLSRISSAQSPIQESTKKAPIAEDRGSKSPIFVVVFYDDGSCENFSMR